MEADFWHQRWRTGQIGFHQSSPHPFLERWWSSLGVPADARVYVPLCGKSLDMVWLAVRGHTVVGTEISGIAVREFFGERQPTSNLVETHGPFTRHHSGAYEILEGDAFALTADLLGPVHAAYDRAALVALPHESRAAYAEHFATLMPRGSQTLLVAFEYDERIKPGPPFSVTPDEVQRLYAPHFVLEPLERVDILAESPKFVAQGVRSLHEVAWSLRRR
jgi:thiopurine S-methyltransferase